MAETRDIAVARFPAAIADSLRFYDQCPFGKGVKHPCLLALMADPMGAPCGIHRIALAEVAGKVDKIGRMALGADGHGALLAANGRLVVGEGIETTLAAATRIPYRGAPLTPAWAAVSDDGIKQLPVIDGVSELILLVDHDRNGAGQNAAMVCERRWRQAGREVVQLMPNERAGTSTTWCCGGGRHEIYRHRRTGRVLPRRLRLLRTAHSWRPRIPGCHRPRPSTSMCRHSKCGRRRWSTRYSQTSPTRQRRVRPSRAWPREWCLED